jgi:hypothetical protein
MRQWALLSTSFTGWSLEEIQNLSFRERRNWLEMAMELGKVARK